ncbi:MAG: DUF1232 domain-containing protein [Candidatus Krumholzibacteria bacterium]|nr:DUF1232 domain-containing protein [Candidatus Krumholzibacteria bacterium]
MSDRKRDFYQQLREQIRAWLQSDEGRSNRWAEYLLSAPDLFHLMWKLSADPDVPAKEKAKLAGALAYFISPIDLIPEGLLGPVGYIDDIALAAYVLNGIVNRTGPEVLARHWAGDENVLVAIRRILAVADEMVGAGVWRKLKRLGGR